MIHSRQNLHDLAEYIASYAQTELERDMTLDKNTIINAIDAFTNGASETGKDYTIGVKLKLNSN